MFKNTILILCFNFSNTLNNKDRLIKLYENFFKKIIVYSDYPVNYNYKDVNYINIKAGEFVHNIFKHFYDNYNNDIMESDGLFYTMDDNIINLNILNLYRNDKIIYKYQELNDIDFYKGWQWDNPYRGKNAIKKYLNETKYSDITQFCGGFADYFYLPKCYLSEMLFNRFHLFAKNYVFLELAIPSIINNLERDKNKYQIYKEDIKWYEPGEREKLQDYNYIKKTFNIDFSLFVHPIKFNITPNGLDWLEEIFLKKKCIVITTINKKTEAIEKFINNKNYDVIIVGDKKTPNTYKNESCIFLDYESQEMLFPIISNLIPYNHYGRKNIGYLFAIKKGYEMLYETDDDNVPYNDFDKIIYFDKEIQTIKDNNNVWINIFKYFTNNSWIWPRGYPLSLIKKSDTNLTFSTNNKKPSIVCGLVENEPDVDSIFRLTSNSEVSWEKNKSIIISNENMCIFNTQNTFWLDKDLFISLLIPSSVSFRYCDILRGIISNIFIKNKNKNIAYTSPNVIQYRNEHDLISDFKSEYEMFINNEIILDILSDEKLKDLKDKDLLIEIYNILLKNKIITQLDVVICKEWLNYF